MKKKVTDKFLVEFDKQKKITGLSQNKLAKMIGYKSGGVSINNMKIGTTQINFENLKLFCEIFKYDINFFLDTEEEESNSVFEENTSSYKTDSRKLDINLNKQIELLERTNLMLQQLFASGIELTNSQIENFKNLRTLM